MIANSIVKKLLIVKGRWSEKRHGGRLYTRKKKKMVINMNLRNEKQCLYLNSCIQYDPCSIYFLYVQLVEPPTRRSLRLVTL
jgi:hypothetical protein